MRILISNSIYNHIVLYCTQHLPHEACGVLVGTYESMSIVIQRFIPLSNIAMNREAAFRIDEQEWTQLLYKGFARDQRVMGFIHSHPSTPAKPSSADLSTLWHTIPTQWIISFLDVKNPVLKAYSFHADGTYELVNWTIQN